MKEIADRLAEELVKHGIRYVFGLTGSGISLDLVTSLEDRGVRFCPAAHEAAAVLMAGACCRDGKVSAAAIGIKGPGFANFIPGILSNYYEARPALTISEAYSSESPRFYAHKRIDHFSMCSAFIKGYSKLDKHFKGLDQLNKLATQEVPGPIHIDIASKLEENISIHINPLNSAGLNSSMMGDEQSEQIIQAIKHSAKPAIILGSMVSRHFNFVRWGEIGVPVLTTAAAKGCIDENSAFYGGLVTGEIKKLSPENAILKEADLIIAFGLRNTEVIRPSSFDAKVIIIDNVEPEFNDGFRADLIISSNAAEKYIDMILSKIASKPWGDDLLRTYWREVDRELYKEEWLPAQILKDIQAHLSSDTILVLDTGLFCAIGEIVWKAKSPLHFCGSSNGRFMGTSIPTAIGLALSNLEMKILCVVGDGGVRPYLAEIKLAVEHKLPILFIYMSDGGYGSVKQAATNRKISETAVEITNSSWYRCVEAMGCESVQLKKKKGLEHILQVMDRKNGPMFIEIIFDPESYASMTMNLR
ncbi:hypothetical protein KZ483_18425 [Paenibacillus sp. sptzw28]|uniref:thiamine pyrophosphate-dependent enzyme n=1 Tax=Paenibacillus sp. sptzw28 TaxID=715179 RepID=UPI001C6F2196|nr:thiamine pyrophosphate-dependent enzyme [Paenibacillus sp. sptzw28]QYR19843.1 hypothetical protein KZ483_18425 [Paenibacillus sp. sptzw28]